MPEFESRARLFAAVAVLTVTGCAVCGAAPEPSPSAPPEIIHQR